MTNRVQPPGISCPCGFSVNLGNGQENLDAYGAHLRDGCEGGKLFDVNTWGFILILLILLTFFFLLALTH